MMLEKENAIANWHELIGATNPPEALLGTLEKMFTPSITANVTHGSDASERAKVELSFFFPEG